MRQRTLNRIDELNPFLKKINAILIERDLTPTSLSLLAGLGSSTLSNLLKRNNVPTFSTLEKICAVLNIRLSSFIKDLEDENPELFYESRSGIKRYDPLSKRKKQLVDDFSALPVSDQNETLKRLLESYNAQNPNDSDSE